MIPQVLSYTIKITGQLLPVPAMGTVWEILTPGLPILNPIKDKILSHFYNLLHHNLPTSVLS